jgi:hypothetical protein
MVRTFEVTFVPSRRRRAWPRAPDAVFVSERDAESVPIFNFGDGTRAAPPSTSVRRQAPADRVRAKTRSSSSDVALSRLSIVSACVDGGEAECHTSPPTRLRGESGVTSSGMGASSDRQLPHQRVELGVGDLLA